MTGLLAHGLVQRANLPLPEWLFWLGRRRWCWSSRSRRSPCCGRRRGSSTTRWRPLPCGRRPRARRACASSSSAARSASSLLVVAIVAGYVGPPDALSNFTPVFVLIIFWVGMAFASVLFGDVFHALNPWRAAGRAVGALAGRRTRDRTRRGSGGGRRRWPVHLHVDRAGLRLARAPGAPGHRDRRLQRRHVDRDGALRRRDLDAPRRGVRGLLQPALAPVDLREARPRGRRAAAARRSAAARSPARHRRLRGA